MWIVMLQAYRTMDYHRLEATALLGVAKVGTKLTCGCM